jgi:CheY-like chemotaxis protein
MMNSHQPVLYAEDDENDAFFMEHAFKQAGVIHPLRVVADGILAQEYLAGGGPYANREQYPMPCLVLLDLKMPGPSGHDVLKWIRSQPATSEIPVVIVTSSNQESDIHRAYLLGANSYLIKPGTPDELVKIVKGLKDNWLSQNRKPGAYANLSKDLPVTE